MWFKSIFQAKICSDVDDSTLNFSGLVDSVQYGNFVQSLPPTFSKTDDLKKRQSNSKSNSNGSKKKNDDSNCSVTSPSPIQEFKMLPGKTWVSNFVGKREGQVKWDKNTWMCPRWFILGRCFSNCHNCASHVESFTNKKHNPFSEFLKKCRSNWLLKSESSGVRPPPLSPEFHPQIKPQLRNTTPFSYSSRALFLFRQSFPSQIIPIKILPSFLHCQIERWMLRSRF